MSAAGRQVLISVTAGSVATMTMLGIVGWNGGHPHPYYWAIVVILTASCILACKKLRPPKHSWQAAARKPPAIGDGSPEPKRTN